jgi:hypothetical protein
MMALLGLVALGLVFHSRLTSVVRFPLQVAAVLWIAALLLVQRPEGVTKIWASLQAPVMIWAAAGITGLLKSLRLKFAWNVSAAAVAVGLAVLIVSVEAARVVPTIPRRWAAKGAARPSARNLVAPFSNLHMDRPPPPEGFDAAKKRVVIIARIRSFPSRRDAPGDWYLRTAPR